MKKPDFPKLWFKMIWKTLQTSKPDAQYSVHVSLRNRKNPDHFHQITGVSSFCEKKPQHCGFESTWQKENPHYCTELDKKVLWTDKWKSVVYIFAHFCSKAEIKSPEKNRGCSKG